MRGRSVLFWVLLIVFSGAVSPFAVQTAAASPPAQSANGSVETEIDYRFGESITFRASFSTPVPIQEAVLLFGLDGDAQPQPLRAPVDAEGRAEFSFDVLSRPVPAFSRLEYRYHLTLTSGEVFTTPYETFFYADNRFEWQTLEDDRFHIHWYGQDASLGRQALRTAQEGLKRVQNLITVSPPAEPVDIYLYASTSDMLAALDPSGQNWAAGHAAPELGQMVVALPPGPDQRALMEQRIPHELMHMAQYQVMGGRYLSQPAWLSEGLASLAELSPNPDYPLLLETAYRQKTLLPMTSLCPAFPRDASGAILAYAQSAAFTDYLFLRSGRVGLDSLLVSYANGLDCEHGLVPVAGLTLSKVERQWRTETFGENITLTALSQFAPWLLLLAAALAAPLTFSLAHLRRKGNVSQDRGQRILERTGTDMLTQSRRERKGK